MVNDNRIRDAVDGRTYRHSELCELMYSIRATMPPTASLVEYCDKCHLPIKTPKVCNECGTASYCVRILATTGHA